MSTLKLASIPFTSSGFFASHERQSSFDGLQRALAMGIGLSHYHFRFVMWSEQSGLAQATFVDTFVKHSFVWPGGVV